MVITNLRGNRERTAYTADLNGPTGHCLYTIDYTCGPFEHAMQLTAASGRIAAYESVSQTCPLGWAEVRAWAIAAAHDDLTDKRKRRAKAAH